MDDECYWRIQLDAEGKYHVCCLQWFDENDYDKTLWVLGANGAPLKMYVEATATRLREMLEVCSVYNKYLGRNLLYMLDAMYADIMNEYNNPFEGETQ